MSLFSKSIKNNSKAFSGADWKAYNDFEFRFAEIVLTRLLKRESLITILREARMNPSSELWIPLTNEEIGNIILNDVPKDVLWPCMAQELKRLYPDSFSYEEAKEFITKTASSNKDRLIEFYVKYGSDENLKDVLRDKEHLNKWENIETLLAEEILIILYTKHKGEREALWMSV